MAQKKINPTGYRLSVKQTWWTIAHTNWPSKITLEDKFIRRIVEGIYKSFNILTSPIIIKRKNQLIIIEFLVYALNQNYNKSSSFKMNPDFPHNLLKLLNSENLIKKDESKNSIEENLSITTTNLSNTGIWDILKNSKNSQDRVEYLNGKSDFIFNYLSTFSKLLLEKLLNVKVTFNITEAPNVTSNAKILCDYISSEISSNPTKYKFVVNRAIRDYSNNSKSEQIEGNKKMIDLFKANLLNLHSTKHK